MLVPESLDEQITATDAANRFGVTSQCISNWLKRGKIEPAGLDHRGRNTYRFIDLLRVAQQTRHNAIGPNRTV